MTDTMDTSPPKVQILWTGGLDSTLLLLKAIKRKDTITTISFVSEKQLNSSYMDGVNRTKIIHQLSKLGIKWTHLEITLPIIDGGIWPTAYIRQEHALWMRLLPLYVCMYYDEVQLGYLVEDPILEHRSSLIKEYRSGEYNTIKLPELTMPLDTYTKADVIGELKEIAEELGIPNIMDISGTCNNMTMINDNVLNCGGCDKCSRSLSHGIRSLGIPISDDTLEYMKIDKGLIIPLVCDSTVYMGIRLSDTHSTYELSVINKYRLKPHPSIYIVTRLAEPSDDTEGAIHIAEGSVLNNRSLLNKTTRDKTPA